MTGRPGPRRLPSGKPGRKLAGGKGDTEAKARKNAERAVMDADRITCCNQCKQPLCNISDSNPDVRGMPTEAGFAWRSGTKAGKDMTMEQTSEARLREALERLMDTLDGLRNGTLTKLEADAIQAAIEEALRVQRFSANH
jgi:hypothetical protein